MLKHSLVFIVLLGMFFIFQGRAEAVVPKILQEYFQSIKTLLMADRRLSTSNTLKESAKASDDGPSINMRLGLLYYDLGLLPEAISEGEKAVAVIPTSKWYRFYLGKFYFVDKQYDKAENQFVAILEHDPGFTLGYNYLGELFFRQKKYDLAWLCMQRANLLGYQENHLKEKLASVSQGPQKSFAASDNDDGLYRFMSFSTEEEAKNTLEKFQNGELFENLQLALMGDKAKNEDSGLVLLSELQPAIAQSIRDMQPFADPEIIKTESDYRVMQRILSFDLDLWVRLLKNSPQMDGQPAKKQQVDTVTPAISPEAEYPDKEKKDDIEFTSIYSPENPVSTGDKKEGLQDVTSKLAIVFALESWVNAWQARDTAGYLAMYGNGFKPPNNLSRSAWEDIRQRSLTRPKSIEIKIIDLLIELQGDRLAVVTFKQVYKSDRVCDTVLKTLTMAREQDNWRIVNEMATAMLESRDSEH